MLADHLRDTAATASVFGFFASGVPIDHAERVVGSAIGVVLLAAAVFSVAAAASYD